MATAANWRDKLRQIEAPDRGSVSRPSAKTAITVKSPPVSDAEARFGTFGTFGMPSGNATGSSKRDGCGYTPAAGDAPRSGDTGLPVSNRPDVALPLQGDSAESRMPIIPSRDDFEERAALVEYGAGVPRDWAEGFARLDLVKPPEGFDERRWRQVVDDGGRFLDGGWAERAAALGWSALDVFGAHPVKPNDSFDAMGLVPLIRGGEVIDVKSDMAVIRMPTGNNLTYYLRRDSREAVALWALSSRS